MAKTLGAAMAAVATKLVRPGLFGICMYIYIYIYVYTHI